MVGPQEEKKPSTESILPDFTDNLPDEILNDIFPRAFPKMDLTHRNGPYVGTIMSVCKRWNTLILTNPRLWTSMHLHTKPNCGDLSRDQPYLVSQALERSKGRPLTIRYTADYPDPEDQYEMVLMLLFSAADRWYDVQFDGPLSYTLILRNVGRWAFRRSPMPRLRSLRVDPSDEGSPIFECFMEIVTGRLFSLTHLSLVHYQHASGRSDPLRALGFPWSQLTHLSLTFGSRQPGAIHKLLARVPNLVNLIMKPLFLIEEPPERPVVLSRLETFSFSIDHGIRTDDTTAWPSTLSFIRAPKLSTLNINLGNGAQDAPILLSCLTPFLESSGRNLRKLYISNVDVQTVLAIVGQAPTIASLGIRFGALLAPGAYEEFVRAISWKQDESADVNILPRLSDLTIDLTSLSSSELFVTFIESRTRPTNVGARVSGKAQARAPLESLRLVYSPGSDWAPSFDSGIAAVRQSWRANSKDGRAGLVVTKLDARPEGYETDGFAIGPDWQWEI